LIGLVDEDIKKLSYRKEIFEGYLGERTDYICIVSDNITRATLPMKT
jgi:hypothetical protein